MYPCDRCWLSASGLRTLWRRPETRMDAGFQAKAHQSARKVRSPRVERLRARLSSARLLRRARPHFPDTLFTTGPPAWPGRSGSPSPAPPQLCLGRCVGSLASSCFQVPGTPTGSRHRCRTPGPALLSCFQVPTDRVGAARLPPGMPPGRSSLAALPGQF